VLYQIRNRTEVKDTVYALHLYFNGHSLRNTSKALFKFVTRSHTAIRDWIQKYNPKRLYYNIKIKIFEFILDETQIEAGSELIWLWVAMVLESKEVLRLNISKERNMSF
jgi:transposase-like protein